MYIHGFDTGSGDPAEVDAEIYFNGAKHRIPRAQTIYGTVFTEEPIDNGYIVVETAFGSYPFTAASTGVDVVGAKHEGGIWYYDPNGSWTTFTPTTTMCVIGNYSGSGESGIHNATVWYHGRTLDEANISANIGGSGITTITGDKISTGKIESTNLSAAAGSVFDLDDGSFKLGGSSAPNLEFDGTNLIISGAISASAGQIGGFTIENNKLRGSTLGGVIQTRTATGVGQGMLQLDGPNNSLILTNTNGTLLEFITQPAAKSYSWGLPAFTSSPYAEMQTWNVEGTFIYPDKGGSLVIDGAPIRQSASPANRVVAPMLVIVEHESITAEADIEETQGAAYFKYMTWGDVDTEDWVDDANIGKSTDTLRPIKDQMRPKAAIIAHGAVHEDGGADTAIAGVYSLVEGIGNSGGDFNEYAYVAESHADQYTFYGKLGVMYNAGEIRSGADVIAYYSSDRRLKDNIFVIKDPIDKIKKISGVEFDWNEKGPHWTRAKYFGDPSGSLHDVGVIAQEVQEVLPEAVRERDNGTLAVKYDKIVPLLIEGIKDQQKQIESLEARIKKLENK